MTALTFHVICGCVFMSDAAMSTSPETEDRPWRQALNCGPSCLYVMLKLHNVGDPDYETVLTATILDENGATLEQLCAVSAKLGLRCAVVRSQLADLENYLPAIIHMDSADAALSDIAA